ncbi:MAG: DUF1987 domain-containing protein [Flavobacteriales bacterium]|nr:DUF1987 domain-containing protein [Flavobacteriales bacterium]
MQHHPLTIEGTDETPFVFFSMEDCRLVIKGRSMPENAYRFYQPLIEHVKLHSHFASRQFIVIIELDYFNSSSGRFILELLLELQKRFKSPSECKVYWVTREDDEIMKDRGLEMKELINLDVEIATTALH